MELIKEKDKIQKIALKAWIDSGKRGAVEIITGLGKSFIFLHALYTMPLGKKQKHLFLAEVVDRERDIRIEIAKYNKIFDRDVFGDYNLEFNTYQSACKWKNKTFGLVGADEATDSITPIYSNFYRNNNYNALIGLAAYFDRDTFYPEISMTKGELLDMIMPVCYNYGIDKGLKEGVARQLNVFIIKHKLDNKTRNVRAGSLKRPFMQTEQQAYDYYDKTFNENSGFITIHRKKDEDNSTYSKRMNTIIQERKRRTFFAINRRAKILYDLPSKILLTKQILGETKGQTIIFGNSINSLLAVTKNVVSSKNKEEVNNAIRDAFEQDKIKVIGSFKKLKQGANLSLKLDNTILMSYYSKQKDLIQRSGRMRKNGKIGNLYIIVTKDTQEEVWVEKMLRGIENYNIKTFNNITQFINYRIK